MGIDSRGGVSIGELIVYVPAIVLSLILCIRHGFRRSSGWLYTLILCHVRIVGAICQLVAENKPSEGLIRATLIIDSIGLSPLLLATLGMLSRLVDWINARGTPTFTVKHFRLVQLLITLALILSIVGGTSGNASSNGTIQPATTSKVAIVLFIVSLVAIIFILVVSWGNMSGVPPREKRIAMAVGAATPFICVRLLYSVLAVFLHNKTFSIVSGDVSVHVSMAVIEEFIVVAIYLFLGFNLEKLVKSDQGLANRPWKGRGDGNSGRAAFSNGETAYHRGETDEGAYTQVGEQHVPLTTHVRG